MMVQKAAGSWEGRVYGGDIKYDVTVELKKEVALCRGFYKASGPGKKGLGANGEFIVSDGELACYKVKVRVFVKPQVEFDAVACPSGPESLRLTSPLARGTLVFSNKFRRAELNFSGMAGSTHGILYRSEREDAQGKGKIRTPSTGDKLKVFKP